LRTSGRGREWEKHLHDNFWVSKKVHKLLKSAAELRAGHRAKPSGPQEEKEGGWKYAGTWKAGGKRVKFS